MAKEDWSVIMGCGGSGFMWLNDWSVIIGCGGSGFMSLRRTGQ